MGLIMNTSIYSSINFSSGKDKFDNTPLQLSAENFDDFETAILSVRSQRKGETYFSGPLS